MLSWLTDSVRLLELAQDRRGCAGVRDASCQRDACLTVPCCDIEPRRSVIGVVAGLNRVLVTLHFFDVSPALGLGLLEPLGRDAVQVVAVAGGTGEANGYSSSRRSVLVRSSIVRR